MADATTAPEQGAPATPETQNDADPNTQQKQTTPEGTPDPKAKGDTLLNGGAKPEPKKSEEPPANTGGDADDPDTPPAGDWPDDWREKYAKGDEKKLKQLQRYGSFEAAMDALFAAQQKIRSGEMKSALPENPSEEELKAWRADNGIPESPDKYDLSLPSGMVIGEDDKPVVDDFLKAAHEANMHPSQVSKALDWYFGKQEAAQRAQDEFDATKKREAEDALRAEFGGEYRRNLQIANDLLAGAPEGVKDQLLGGRMADGTPIGNSPAVIQWLVGLSRELNPIGTVVPGSGTNAMQAVENEIADIRKLMADHNSEYWKGPKAKQLQNRYHELIAAKQKVSG